MAAVIASAAGLTWWFTRPAAASTELILYGNVDLRQVQLAFNNSERIAGVKAKEGDRVRKGDMLAWLDTSRLEPMVAQAEAQLAAQNEVFKRLRAGSRPEEISQARANVASAEADLANLRRQYERLKKLGAVRLSDQSEVRAVSQEDVDNAKAALAVGEAKLTVQQKALDLALLGPRREEVDEADARYRANQAQLAILNQQLADAKLLAPVDAVVRTRLMEPGEMATPQKPVFALAIIDPKWVRAYVSEPDLGKVREGMKASIVVDSFPNRRFEGWVGFISPVAEFTPKAVQTEELRTSLVYEVRVFVKDPDNGLRLGMPATVHLALGQDVTKTPETQP
ncbi:MAG TPA: efflux RND transporter periplasmic adaptor subunit [Gemmataceae bacterium]|nr:efflux RND transporter periplasmic adaptor subunit [Gemmataceae bacterium]